MLVRGHEQLIARPATRKRRGESLVRCLYIVMSAMFTGTTAVPVLLPEQMLVKGAHAAHSPAIAAAARAVQ
jgi:hypothetical protein